MDDMTKHDIRAVLRSLEKAREVLAQIPFTFENADAWNKKSTAACEVAFAVGYLGAMLKESAAVEKLNG